MLKNFSIFLCLVSAFLGSELHAAPGLMYHQTMTGDGLERLKQCMMKMQVVPGVRKLMTEIEKQGPIHVTMDDRPLSQQFGAFWDADRRAICVNISGHRSNGALIGSILFEMHNALSDSRYQELDELAAAGRIDKATYVEEMEREEYRNSLAAAVLAQEGIDMGIFPREARLPTYSSFEEHFRMQQIGGHSLWFARNFDQVAGVRVRGGRRG